jgi:Arc/MetJ-type ribon-helix-helix transcriptional regulator
VVVKTDPLDHSLADAPENELVIPAPDELVPEAEPMLKTSIRLPLDLKEWADEEAKRRGLSNWSELVRHLLEIARHGGDQDVVIVKQLMEAIERLRQPPGSMVA